LKKGRVLGFDARRPFQPIDRDVLSACELFLNAVLALRRTIGAACAGAKSAVICASLSGLKHDPEKVDTGFPKRSCSTKDLERDDDST
jgi:hypothetical protein